MKNLRNFISLFILIFLLGACEHGSYKQNIRTPHLPVFPEITPQQKSSSNPYWSRFTLYKDKQSLKLNTGTQYTLENPTLIGSLGTHYRFPQDIYIFGMTGSVGAQYDLLFWKKGKLSLTGAIGFNQNLGGQVSVSQEIGKFKGASLTPYFSLQRRGIVIQIFCRPEGPNDCVAGDSGRNNIVVREDVINTLLGLEWGRLKLGEKGNTTLNFRTEVGLQHTIWSKLENESYLSDYTHDKTNLMFSIHCDLTLW